jgi:hypothetical protein
MLLPTAGDPYIVKAWIVSYKKYCQQYVDQLYVNLNTTAGDEVFNYVVSLFEELDAKIITHRNLTDHGPAITEMMDICTEDVVFLTEDDFYLQIPDQLDKWFKNVEEGDVGALGSMRGCVNDEIIQATARKFNLKDKEAYQTNFWPALFVAKREDLMKTDKNFGSKTFKAGELIEELDFTPVAESGADTFVWASIQLRAQGLYIHQVPHHRWIDVLHSRLIPPPWIHIGSSSCSLNGFLLGDDMTSISNVNDTTVRECPIVPDKGIRTHYEALFSGWSVFRDTFPIPDDSPAAFFNDLYTAAIERNIVGCKLRPNEIEKNKDLYHRILAPLLSE